MRITAIEITDYKRVQKVAITPHADRSVVLIGGKNGQGKSSTLDALTAAFGGKRSQAADPVRHGAGEAAIYVELDGGKLTIDRTIAPDGTTTLEVRDPEGAVRSPQAMLDKLVGARFLDPLAFLQLTAKEQRAQLMRAIEGADRIDGLNEKRARAFDRRTEIGRDLTKAEGELARLPEVEVGVAIDVAGLTAEAKKLADLQRAGDGLGNMHTQAQREADGAKAQLDETRKQIARLEDQLALLRKVATDQAATVLDRIDEQDAAKAKVDAAAAAWAELAPRREQLDVDLARAGDHNRAVFEAEAKMKRRAEAAAEVDRFTAQREELTKVIAEIDRRKAEILGAAKLPINGLAVTDDGIALAGVPFAQASGAERLRVALALAIAASPGLDDVWIRDGALLDDDSLALVVKQAAAAGKRVWIERVGDRDPGVIVIQDGKVIA